LSALAVDDRAVAVEVPNDDYAILTQPLPGEASGSIALGQSLASSVAAIRANKLRAFLTMLGIIIGVAAVIVMIALGQGASQSVQARLAGLGTNILSILPASFGGPGGVQIGAGARQSLTEADAQAIEKQVAGVAAVSPEISGNNTQVQAGNQNWSTQVRAVYPSYFAMNSWRIAEGAFFDADDQANGALGAVIGQTVATNLYGTADPVGQTITVRNVPMKVKGVLAAKGSNGFQDQDDVVLIPFTTGQVRLFHQTYVRSITVQVKEADQMTTVQEEITYLLRTHHRLQGDAQSDFTVHDNNQLQETVAGTTQTLTYLLAGVAAVSLLVGGIGIMNIMLVSVTERVREIGIRMAIGAKPGNVLLQFLIEAVLLSLVGGAIGILLGVGGSFALAELAGWSMAVTWPAIALSFGFAAFVGVFFGYYPARSAARLDPIEALRYD
jgi:putative ABC transport system permease protein